MRIPESFESKKNETAFFQNKESIPIEEVKDGEHADFSILEEKGEKMNSEETHAEIKKRAEARYWWLRDYWRKKGEPVEQVTIKIGEKKINISNFSRALTREEIVSIKKAIELIANVRNGELLGDIHTILVNNEQPKNPKSGEPTYGENEHNGVIRLDPRVLEERDIQRIPGARALEAVIIHEFAHTAPPELMNLWWKEMGWEYDTDHPIPLGSGANTPWRNNHQEKILNDYARQDPKEDFCESVAAALLTPEIVSPERFSFIQEHVLSSLRPKNERVIPIVTRLKGEAIKPPRIDKITFKRKESKPFTIKKIEE